MLISRSAATGVIYTRGDESHQTSVLSFVSLLRHHIFFLSADVWLSMVWFENRTFYGFLPTFRAQSHASHASHAIVTSAIAWP